MISFIFYLLTLTVLVSSSSSTTYQNSVCNWIRGTGNSTNRINAGQYGTPNDCAIVCLAMKEDNKRPNGASITSNSTNSLTCWCEFGLTNIVPNSESTSPMICFLKEIIHQIEAMATVFLYTTSIQFTNKRLAQHVTFQFATPPQYQQLELCYFICLTCNSTGAVFNCKCRSFNTLVKGGNFTCEMNSASHEEYPQDFITQEGSQHYLVDSKYSKKELEQWLSSREQRP